MKLSVAECVIDFEAFNLKEEEMKFRGVAFISGRFRGPNHWLIHLNVLKAEAAIPKLLEMGYAPICPHKITEHMQDLFPDKTYLDMCLEIIRALRPTRDILYMLEGWEYSEGAIEEFDLAKDLGITIIEERDER